MPGEGTYVRVSDHLPEHPKISAAGGEAGWLFVAGLCYCSRNLTDGFIPASVVGRLTDLRRPGVLASRLVEAGLWHGPGHGCSGCPPVAAGFVVHDYLDFQRSAGQVAEVRAKRAAAGRRGGRAKAQARHRAGTVPAGGQDGDTGPPVATGTPQTQAEVSVPSVRESPVLVAEDLPPPGSHRAREPATETGAPDVDGLVEEVRRVRPDWSAGRIRAAVTHPDVAVRPAGTVAAAVLRLAADPATRHPGRLRHPGPWWATAEADTRPAGPREGAGAVTGQVPRLDPRVNARGLAAARAALHDRRRSGQPGDAGPGEGAANSSDVPPLG